MITQTNGSVQYEQLVIAMGLQLDWSRIEGLVDTLGKNGVTSNYRFDLAPYTWQLVQQLTAGPAIFTHPPMPIKCAGASQKAMYLSCDHWLRQNRLQQIKVSFTSAAPALFGVKEYVEPLMAYIRRYQIDLNLNTTLVAVDGPQQLAWFDVKDKEGNTRRISKPFAMLHVVPPQSAPDVLKSSVLGNAEAGWRWISSAQTSGDCSRKPAGAAGRAASAFTL